MKRTSKLIALLIAAIMIVSLCACGGAQTTTTTTTTTTDNTAKTETSTQTEAQKPIDTTTATIAEDPTTLTTAADGEEPQYGGIFRFWRPNICSGLNEFKVNRRDFMWPAVETLVRVNKATNELTPMLATSWEENVEEKSITFHLREGVQFHDGSPFNAEAVQWNYENMSAHGKGDVFYNAKVEIVDEYTVKAVFEEYHLDGVQVFADVGMYSKKAYEELGEDAVLFHPVATGPFVFSEFITDAKVSYVRNENYWQEGKPYLDGIEIYSITDSDAAVTAFLNDEIDYFTASSSTLNIRVQAEGFQDLAQRSYAGNGIACAVPNSRVEGDPFYNVEVRKAVFLYGIDWESVMALAGQGCAVTWHDISMEGALCYNPDVNAAFEYNPEKAKTMLAEAGYPDGFETTIHTGNVALPMATTLQAELKKIGITAEVHKVNSSDTSMRDGVTPGISCINLDSFYDCIPNYSVKLRHAAKSFGLNMIITDKLEEYFQAAANATDFETRAEAGKKLVYQAVVEDCVISPAYYTLTSIYMNSKVHDNSLPYLLYAPELIWIEQ